jgi:hypothetical protein
MTEEISMAEKRRILAEERISSYRAHAEANADFDLGGRYGLVQKPAVVIGASPGVSYPKLPENSPSNQLARMPDEPSLGYSVNDQEPVGEAHEVRASQAKKGW